MEPIRKIKGKVIPLDRPNIDTDAILPKEFLTRIERTGFGQFLFYYWRFNEDGTINNQFIFNKVEYKNATVLLTRKNFGCGSSREHAPWSLKDYGIKVIIAESFADIFYNNCFKNGLLPITLKQEQIDYLFEQASNRTDFNLYVDLEECIITDNNSFTTSFDIEDFRKKMLMEGIDDIGLSLNYSDHISKFEEGHTVHYFIP
ncbi:3-isopropylmalate dehydratase small subunit [Bacillus sp. B15-48]|uniref:3-isopropylmalate dehydratase small subunit n=1 Tax=Bacillus sp. B15-48 TaxID=1548601 RepID=UPI00193EF693|nr:3-isopropylmalate dehydratase small subunit [Bacillus sp. B15-48]MBM4764700.1 3-isopropylmalate dehydratase small subunit [Bacillus sp. B15-48]